MNNAGINVQLSFIGQCVIALEEAWENISTPSELWLTVESALERAGFKNIVFYSRSGSIFQDSEPSMLHILQLGAKNSKLEIKLTKRDEQRIIRDLECESRAPYTRVSDLIPSSFTDVIEAETAFKAFEHDTYKYVMCHFRTNHLTGYTVFNAEDDNLLRFGKNAKFLRSLFSLIHDKLGHMNFDNRQGVPKISPREKQVLQLLVKGKTNSEIASELAISPHTIGSYINVLGLKLSSRNRTATAIRAVALGLVRI